MSVNPTIEIGNGNWAVKDGKLLGYRLNEQSGYKPVEFDFTRVTKATRVNKEGLIEEVAENIPRIDYSNDKNGELLVEPPRTNLITWSEQITSWSQNDSVTENNVDVSPNGLQTASKVTVNADNGFSGVVRTAAVTTGIDYTFSVYLKADTPVDLFIGILSPSIGTTVSVTNEWQRFTFTTTATVTGNRFPQVGTLLNEAVEFYMWGAQFEQGSYATSYIPTEGSAVTRNGDIITTSNLSSLLGQSEGTIFLEIPQIEDKSLVAPVVGFDDGSLNNGIWLYQLGSGVTALSVRANAGSAGGTGNIGQSNIKVALSYNSSTYVAVKDGVKIYDSGTVTPFSADLTRFFVAGFWFVLAKSIKAYKKALSDNELIELTS